MWDLHSVCWGISFQVPQDFTIQCAFCTLQLKIERLAINSFNISNNHCCWIFIWHSLCLIWNCLFIFPSYELCYSQFSNFYYMFMSGHFPIYLIGICKCVWLTIFTFCLFCYMFMSHHFSILFALLYVYVSPFFHSVGFVICLYFTSFHSVGFVIYIYVWPFVHSVDFLIYVCLCISSFPCPICYDKNLCSNIYFFIYLRICPVHFNPIALRKAKMAYNFGFSECNRVNKDLSPTLFHLPVTDFLICASPFSGPVGFLVYISLRFYWLFSSVYMFTICLKFFRYVCPFLRYFFMCIHSSIWSALLLYPCHLCWEVYSFRFSVHLFVCSFNFSFVCSLLPIQFVEFF